MTSLKQNVKVILHGYLKSLYPGDIQLNGSTVAEIINGMCKQTKAFEPELGDDRHTIMVKGFTTKESLDAPLGDINELHLFPAMTGGKSGGFFKIVIGAVLIAAAIWTGGTSLTLGPVLFGTTTLAGVMFNVGLSLVLGGLMEMMSPAPKIDKATGTSTADPEASKYLGPTANTTRIGTRIPLGYGRFKAYGHYLSFDVDAVDVAV